MARQGTEVTGKAGVRLQASGFRSLRAHTRADFSQAWSPSL